MAQEQIQQLTEKYEARLQEAYQDVRGLRQSLLQTNHDFEEANKKIGTLEEQLDKKEKALQNMKKQQYAYMIQVSQLQSVIENNKKEMMDVVVKHNQECDTLRFTIEKLKTEAKEMSLEREEERKTLEGHILKLKQQLSEAEDQSTKKL